MRRALGIVLGIVLLATGLIHSSQSAPPATQAAQTGTAAISGVVSDGLTGQPIAGARVTIYPVDPASPGGALARPAVLTDARGRFVFVNLPAARYNMFSEHVGHNVGGYEGAATPGTKATSSGQSVSIKVIDGEWMRDANIRMWRGSAISGRVLDEKNEPAIGCAVRLFLRKLVSGHEQLVEGPVATTDDRGVYRFPFLDPGRYFVAVLSVQATVPVGVADATSRPPVGALEGRGSGYEPRSLLPEARGASIDVDGAHRLVLTNFATPPPPGADGPRAYAPVFYPNARVVTDAQAVEVEFGTSRDGIDFQLAPFRTFRVAGQVTGAVEGVANNLLRLMAAGTEHLGFGAEVATTLIEADGTFTFLNVPAGHYTIVASQGVAEVTGGGSSQGTLPKSVGYGLPTGYSMSYPGAPGLNYMWWVALGRAVWGRTDVSVGAADVTGLALMLRQPASVHGRVVFDEPLQPQSQGVQGFTLSLEPVNGDPSLGAPFVWIPDSDASHSFTLYFRGGRYIAGFQPSRGWRIASVMSNGVDVTETGFDGSLGTSYDNVVITLTKAGAQISGVVRDARGQAAQGAVLVFPVDPKRWVDYGLTAARLRSTSAASDGAYKFSLLPEGDYFVVAVPPGQNRGWLDPKFLAAAAGKATRVALATGASKTQDLQLSEVIVK